MNSAKYRFLTLVAILSLLGIGTLYGQTAVTGGIEGNVTDASGAAVAGATVEAIDVPDAVTRDTVTNNDGAYRFPSLIPGTYSVTIKKAGFATFLREATRIDAGIIYRIDAKLPVGTATSKVEVTGAAPLLQTDSAEVNETIHSSEISSLPTFGNNITRLSLLAPGVSMPGGQLDLHPENAGSDFNLNVNGAAPNANGHLLDGVENTEAIQGLSIIVAPNDSVQEVKLTTSDYDAEYGKVAGGLWQITTKSGTNAFHGTAFENYRTSGFNAADHFSEPNGVPGNRWNQFGGSLGGPVIKDKIFFFGDYQGMRNNLHASGAETVPIDAFRTGDFSSIAATDPIYDPATGNPDGTGRTQIQCNGVLNVICPDRISQAAKNLLALLPQPNVPGADSSNYLISRPATFDQNQFDTRVDYFVTSKTVVFGKFTFFHADFSTPTAYGVAGGGPPLGGVGVANAGNSTDHDKSAMVDYQHTFSPSLLTEARFSFSRLVIQELQPDYQTDAATAVGIPDINLGTVYTSGLPQISVTDPVTPFAMGDFGLPFFEREANFEFYNNWTKTVGHHAFKFGADIGKFFGIRTDVSGRGAFSVSNLLTQNNDSATNGPCSDPAPGTNCGSGLAALELGLTSGFGRDITLVQPQEKLWKYAFYGQDTWQVTPKLTLTLGLRWDYMSPIFTPNGESVGNLDLNTGNILLTNLAGKYAGVKTPKTEFSPRLGVSFRVFKDTVLRGGYGRSYYMNADGAGFGTQGGGWPIKQSQSDTQVNAYTPLPYTLDQGPGLPAPLPAYPANGMIPFDGTLYSEYFVGVGTYPHSYNDTYNVTLEHAFPHQITASVAYVGNIGRHLWDNINMNLAVPGPGDLTTREPLFAKFGWTQPEYERNDEVPGRPEMRSNYNSLQLHLEKRFHQGLYILSNFTWAKSLDDGTFGPGDGNGNQFCYSCNYGPTGAVRPWTFISAANWELPFGHGRAYANSLGRGGDAVVGGWALSGVFNLESGLPFTPYYSFSGNAAHLNDGIYDRPDLIGDPHVSNPNRNEWYNPAAYAAPTTPYTFGNAGRNSLMGPGYGEVDLSLTKSFAITEKTHLDLKWDVFNALNEINLAQPTEPGAAFVDFADAGQINSIVDFRRRMQLGLHLTF